MQRPTIKFITREGKEFFDFITSISWHPNGDIYYVVAYAIKDTYTFFRNANGKYLDCDENIEAEVFFS